MRTLAIGDIHGCLMALHTLLFSLDLRADDRLVFLGDYIDRGPDSSGVLEKMIELSAQPQHVFLRGNHDDWLLRAPFEQLWFDSWLDVGGAETLHSYGASSVHLHSLDLIPDKHWNFLAQTRLYFESDAEIYVHASISQWPASQNDRQTLMWRSFWDIAPHPSKKRIVCGHTWQEGGLPINQGFAVCLDTLGGQTGWLSALDVASDKVFQANEQGQTRSFHLGEPPGVG